jgi:hypothetical protein
MWRRPVGRMPLTTRFLFEVVLEAKIDPLLGTGEFG